jgi:hypothetical protein
MSPVVIVGFGAIDAALISQAIYAIRDLRRPDAPDELEVERRTDPES